MNRQQQEDEARRLGRTHAHQGDAPYGDLDDAGSADLMTALGETDDTTAENHNWRRMLCAYYMDGWEQAAGRNYMTPAPPPGALTMRRLVLGLAADGIDAQLEPMGGPGEWPVPMGYLGDGRGWILSSGIEEDYPAGPDEHIPARLHLQVYENATENARRWPNKVGLEFNDPIGILGNLSPGQAGIIIRAAWSGDYSDFTDDTIPPAPLPEDARIGTLAEGRPMFDERTRHYLRACRLASPAALAPYRTEACPECGFGPTGGGLVITENGQAAHVMVRGYVVLGCEGYFVVDPAALGLDRGEWDDWRMTMDAGYINADDDGEFMVTLMDAYVVAEPDRLRARSYPEALAILKRDVAALPPYIPEPPMFYVNHATGLVIRFPSRLDGIAENWARNERPEDAAWFGALGPHIGVEAMCLLCGQIASPHGPDDLVHGVRLDPPDDHEHGREVPCGGPLVPVGAWGAPVAPGRASAIRPVGPRVGLPYAWVNPATGAATCPACQEVIAEGTNATGEATSTNYAGHYQAKHMPA
jgi:hypothetical protein